MTKRKKVNREEVEESESLSKEKIAEFVNLSLASSKVQSIQIEEENDVYNLRPNINLFIFGSIGSSKSTLLNQVSEKTGSKAPFSELTFPALIGSIDKMTRQLIIGACWECRNSLLLLDEFDFSKRNKDDIKALLQLVEGGRYNRKLASFSAPQEEEEEDLYFYFKNGEFNIKTRFSLILATMKYPYTSQNQELQALMSRSVCLPFYPDKNVLMKIAQGYSIFNFKDKTPKNKKIKVSKKDYDYILEYVDEKVGKDNFLRIVGDCVRVFAIEGKHNHELYDLLIKFGNKKFQSKKPQ